MDLMAMPTHPTHGEHLCDSGSTCKEFESAEIPVPEPSSVCTKAAAADEVFLKKKNHKILDPLSQEKTSKVTRYNPNPPHHAH